MSLSDLAAIGSFISGLAVVITLLFLLLQMRQTNKNQRALMQHGRSTRNIETLARSLEPHMQPSFTRAMAGDLTLNPQETTIGVNMMYMMFMNFEDSFLQNQSGTIDQNSWAWDEGRLRLYLARPAFRAGWRLRRANFGDAFRDCVDRIMAETKAMVGPDWSAAWKEYLVEEIAAAT